MAKGTKNRPEPERSTLLLPAQNSDPARPEFLDELRGLLLEAALAVQILFESKDYRVASKGAAGPVSSADLLANYILRRGLTRLLPEAGWLSEESRDSQERLEREYVWIVDPIDGTREFVNGVPEYSVSVGLVRFGEPVLGAVALPADQRIVCGGPGLGLRVYRHASAPADFFDPALQGRLAGTEPGALAVYLEGAVPVRNPGAAYAADWREEPVAFSDRRDLDGARVLVSSTEHRRGKLDVFTERLELRPSGSIARKLALLAAGEGDLNISIYPKNEWDICGGTALVLAAPGGRVVELESGAPVRYNSENPQSYGLAAGPAELVDAFVQYFRDGGFSLEREY